MPFYHIMQIMWFFYTFSFGEVGPLIADDVVNIGGVRGVLSACGEFHLFLWYKFV